MVKARLAVAFVQNGKSLAAAGGGPPHSPEASRCTRHGTRTMAVCSRRRSHALLPVFGSARASSSRLSSTTIIFIRSLCTARMTAASKRSGESEVARSSGPHFGVHAGKTGSAPGKMVKVSALEALILMVKVGSRSETLFIPWDYGRRASNALCWREVVRAKELPGYARGPPGGHLARSCGGAC